MIEFESERSQEVAFAFVAQRCREEGIDVDFERVVSIEEEEKHLYYDYSDFTCEMLRVVVEHSDGSRREMEFDYHSYYSFLEFFASL